MRILRKKLARPVLASEVPIGAAALPLQAQLSGHAAYAFPARPRRPPTLRRHTTMFQATHERPTDGELPGKLRCDSP